MAYRAGKPLPDRIANAPELFIGLELYYRAYMDLDSDRSVGMSVGLIPWSACLTWAQAYDLSFDQFDSLVYFVNRMDMVYLEHQEKKSG